MGPEPGSPTAIWRMAADEPGCPAWLPSAASSLVGIGNRALLEQSFVGLVCSVQCPGSIVIKTFDAIRELRDASVALAGGFHSPMERACLEFLLRGKQPVVVCLAKGLQRPRLPSAWRDAICAGRLLLLSPFDDKVRRTTKATAHVRNRFVAAMATAVLIPHAAAGGNAETIAQEVVASGKPLFTIDDGQNESLLLLGAARYGADGMCRAVRLASSPDTFGPTNFAK